MPANAVVETDLCIIGAGAAGISIAREFAGGALRVALVESGGFTADPGTNALNRARSEGIAYPMLPGCRMRLFGGSTTHWAGRCRPYEESDFARRPWIPGSGWPFDRAHLDPYYARAGRLCELPDLDWRVAALEKRVGAPALALDSPDVESSVFYMSPPTRFGTTYRPPLQHARNIRIYLHSNLLEFETDETAARVRSARLRGLGGNEFRLKARAFVLAGGGLENPRLLLLSNRVQKAGLGNAQDLVGRHFMDHPNIQAGIFAPSKPRADLRFYKLWPTSKAGEKVPSMGWLSLTARAARREKIGNYTAALVRIHQPKPRKKASLPPLLEHAEARVPEDVFSRHVTRAMANLDSDGSPLSHLRERFAAAHQPVTYQLISSTEMAPNAASRVRLGSERDALGQPRLVLDLAGSELDRKTVQRGTEILAYHLARAGLGRVKLTYDAKEPWQEIRGRCHHMGTTRMSDDPRQGVVDANCRVHGVSNLFVTGSSVFPTGGAGVATLTIVALALRLAEHLGRRFEEGKA
ncbi:MAG: GMC family oxidoreductase [Deltaproteobacteria bacterium]|nr:GMC family oxidoreductase [Deltaproteobacteria bacterium]